VTGVAALQLGGATATGDALISALDAIKLAPADPAHPNDPAPARIVLLSDGARTAGRSVSSAIAVVSAAKVAVSTISFGTPYGTVSEGGISAPVPADEETMRQIATGTGGKYYSAHVARSAAGGLPRHRLVGRLHVPEEGDHVAVRRPGPPGGGVRDGVLAGVLRAIALTPGAVLSAQPVRLQGVTSRLLVVMRDTRVIRGHNGACATR